MTAAAGGRYTPRMRRTLRLVSLGLALWHAPSLALGQAPGSIEPEEAPAEVRHPAWPAAMGWVSVGTLAVSVGLLIGATARIDEINQDPRWEAARAMTPATEDVCEVTRDAWVATRCDEGERLTDAASWAVVLGAASLLSAVIFFTIDLTGAADERVALTASGAPGGGSLTLRGWF